MSTKVKHASLALRYGLWPTVKVRVRYWWWILRFRGKKNIPQELVFGEMAKSMARMVENLQKAVRTLPRSGATHEGIRELSELLREAGTLDDAIGKLRNEARTKSQ